MKPKHFNLVKYSEIIPIVNELNKVLNKEAFSVFKQKFISIFNNTKQIFLDEDCIIGYEKGNIFYNKKDYSEELKGEILRPITQRQITCFRNCLNVLYSDREYYVKNEERYEHDSLLELVDCFLDYNRCEKKEYISYSEYLLFHELIDIFSTKLK